MSDEVTDWISYTPTITRDGDPFVLGDGAVGAFWRFVGDTLEIRWSVVFGSTTDFGDGDLSVTFPTGKGITLDPSKVPSVPIDATDRPWFDGSMVTIVDGAASRQVVECYADAGDVTTKVLYFIPDFAGDPPSEGDTVLGTFRVPVRVP